MEIDWQTADFTPRAPSGKALAALTRAVAAEPQRPALKLMLAHHLYERGNHAEIETLLASLDGAQADFLRGRSAGARGEMETAIALLTRAGEVGECDLAIVLARAGRAEDAIAVARRVLARAPDDVAALQVLGKLLLNRGEAQAAYDLADGLWRGGTHRAQVAWTRAWAARALGRDSEFRALTEREPWFATTRLDLDDAALVEAVLGAQTLQPPPTFRPIRGQVRRVDKFEAEGGAAVRALHAAVRAQIERYRAERLHIDHPLMEGWPRRLALESWALAMRDDGIEDWHIHAGAWVSAVYYVRNPAREFGGEAGCLGVGALPRAARWPGGPIETWQITPEPGLLVIFPAWYAHRTWSTGTQAERISVAFNASPA